MDDREQSRKLTSNTNPPPLLSRDQNSILASRDENETIAMTTEQTAFAD